MDIISFFNSSFFIAVTTFLTGLFLFVMYRMQKADEKKKAANILLLEIRNAEKEIIKIKEMKKITEITSVLSTNHWGRLNHLFVKDFDRDELDMLHSFYSKCSVIESNIQALNNYLPLAIDEKSRAIERSIVDIAKQMTDDTEELTTEIPDKFKAQVDKFTNLVGRDEYWYLPHAPQDRLFQYLGDIQLISTSSCGTKLKQLAGTK